MSNEIKMHKRCIKYYTTKCDECGKVFEVSKNSGTTTCDNCVTMIAGVEKKRAIDAANNKISHLIGSTIESIDFVDYGRYTEEDEISEIDIITTCGKKITLRADGFDAPYISWEENN